MKYFVALQENESPVSIDVTELPSGALEVKRDGHRIEVDVVALGKTLSVLVDGRVIDLTTEGTPPELGVVASGHRSYVRVESERMRAAQAATGGARSTSSAFVKSPMPGRVVKVLVSKNDEISLGQPLFVIEAMKMENEVRAKRAGVVAEVFVVAGSTIENGGSLLSFV